MFWKLKYRNFCRTGITDINCLLSTSFFTRPNESYGENTLFHRCFVMNSHLLSKFIINRVINNYTADGYAFVVSLRSCWTVGNFFLLENTMRPVYCIQRTKRSEAFRSKNKNAAESRRRTKEIVSGKFLRAIKGAASYLQGFLFKVATGLGKRVDNAVSKQPPSSGNQPLVHCNYRAQPCHARLQRNEKERQTDREREIARERGGERELRLWDRELGKG